MWTEISTLPEYNYYGVYKIRLFDKKMNKPVVIPRFQNQDSDGILMIGHTSNIRNRIQTFRRAYQNGRAPHSEGRTLFLVRKFFYNQQFDNI
ncbi:MAG: hypothetical protein AB7E08_05465, partial [Candidatus Omnitrophota bacterium]